MSELPETFTSKVRESDCLVWIGATNNQGYGVLMTGGQHYLAHRFAYVAEYGDIPAGHVIDHMCRVRNCVNPAHLEAVTVAENNRRGRRARGLQVGDTCNNGHLIGEDDLYVRASGATECQFCRRSCNHSGKDRKRVTTQRRAPQVAIDLDRIAESA